MSTPIETPGSKAAAAQRPKPKDPPPNKSKQKRPNSEPNGKSTDLCASEEEDGSQEPVQPDGDLVPA